MTMLLGFEINNSELDGRAETRTGERWSEGIADEILSR